MERDSDTADDGLASTDSTTNTDAANDLSRRNVLKTTGALGALAVGGVFGTGTAAAAPNTEPETIEGSYNVVLEDGDVLANKHIVSNGSRVSIVANGSDWEIRNVGIEGKPPENPITVRVTDSGGSGLIENVYVEGISSRDETPLFVHRKHKGTVTIRNVNVGNASDSHGIYASAPGSPSYRKQGGGGAVHIESCYAHDTGGNGFRIGSDGSYVKDSVAANCDNSGVWNQWQRGRVENVAIEADVNAFNVGANSYDNRGSECKLSVSNVEYDAPNEVRKAPGIGDWDYYSASGVTRTSSPDLSPPSGVPMSAAEAASGGSGGADDSSDSDLGDEPSEETDETDSSGSDESNESSDSGSDEETTDETASDDTDVPDSVVPVEVTADSDNDGSIDYELTADGTFYRSSDDDPEDGVGSEGSSVSGTVWPGFTDTFYLDGDLTNAEYDGEATVTVDGSTADGGSDSSSDSGSDEEGESDGTDSTDDSASADEDRSLEVEGVGDTTNGPHEYSVTVTGTITDLEGNPDDTVSDDGSAVDGTVWVPFFDRYAFSGEIDSFDTDGSVEVRVDGETVDPDSL